MASNLMKCFYFIFIIISVISVHTVECVEFYVGGDKGWVASKHQQLYNDWASKNRFQVNDTLRFVYKKDSVMMVTEEEYEKCGSVHPMLFSNTGDTRIRLNRPGLFYFISGVSGHCEKGLNMIVKVLEPESPPPPPPAQQSAASTALLPLPALFVLLSSLVVHGLYA
ncbi:hypothetical protein ACS0TY_033204 [Phlomoides rotata]